MTKTTMTPTTRRSLVHVSSPPRVVRRAPSVVAPAAAAQPTTRKHHVTVDGNGSTPLPVHTREEMEAKFAETRRAYDARVRRVTAAVVSAAAATDAAGEAATQ